MTFDSESELQKIRRVVHQQKERDVQVVEVRSIALVVLTLSPPFTRAVRSVASPKW